MFLEATRAHVAHAAHARAPKTRARGPKDARAHARSISDHQRQTPTLVEINNYDWTSDLKISFMNAKIVQLEMLYFSSEWRKIIIQEFVEVTRTLLIPVCKRR